MHTEMKVLAVTEFESDLDIDIRGTEERIPLLDYTPRIERALNILAYLYRYIHASRSKKRTSQRNVGRCNCW